MNKSADSRRSLSGMLRPDLRTALTAAPFAL